MFEAILSILRALMGFNDFAIDALAKELVKNPVTLKILDKLGVVVPETNIDERIRKIELARENLTDALGAIDDLKLSAQRNKIELETLRQALHDASLHKLSLDDKNQSLEKLAAVKVETIRSTFNLPSRKQILRGHALSFVIGIFVAWVLPLGYDFIVKPGFLVLFPTFK